jgi:ribosomal protein L37AE/L43A
MPTVRCPKCDRPVTVRPGGAVFCAGCGAHVSDSPEPPEVVPVDDDDHTPPERAGRRRRRRAESEGDSAVPCPACGSRWIRRGPWPWYLGTVGLMFCKAMQCEKCGHEFDLYKPHANLAKRKLMLALVINGIGLVGIIAVIVLLIVWLRMSMRL